METKYNPEDVTLVYICPCCESVYRHKVIDMDGGAIAFCLSCESECDLDVVEVQEPQD